MTAGSPPSRWISLCAAALVLAELGGMAHLAAAPHGVCWEHGAVVDADGPPGQLDAVALPGLPGVDRAPGAAVHPDTHPHCSALSVVRAARTEVRSSWAIGVRQGEVSPSHAPDSVPAAAGRALRSAPKQSPPV